MGHRVQSKAGRTPLTLVFFTRAHLSFVQSTFGPGAPRLLLSYVNQSINALDLLPAGLVDYVENLILSSSSIQILNFDTESILQAALKYITADGECPTIATQHILTLHLLCAPVTALQFMVRDFNMTNIFSITDSGNPLAGNSTVDTALQGILNQLQTSQQASGLAGALGALGHRRHLSQVVVGDIKNSAER